VYKLGAKHNFYFEDIPLQQTSFDGLLLIPVARTFQYDRGWTEVDLYINSPIMATVKTYFALKRMGFKVSKEIPEYVERNYKIMPIREKIVDTA